MGIDRRKLRQLSALDKKLQAFPALTYFEQETFDAELRFDAVYYSNKLEGNVLTRDEARKAVADA